MITTKKNPGGAAPPGGAAAGAGSTWEADREEQRGALDAERVRRKGGY